VQSPGSFAHEPLRQLSTVQALPSSQSLAVAQHPAIAVPRQTVPEQVSFRVQAFWSSQAAPSFGRE
jgi:hypothetical protein